VLRLWLVLILAAPISGCLFCRPEDTAAAVVAADDEQCQSFGAQPWTPAYMRCRAAIFHRRQEVAAALAGVPLDGPPVAPVPYGPQVLMAPIPISPAPPIHATY
jgi:hypothetical protein